MAIGHLCQLYSGNIVFLKRIAASLVYVVGLEEGERGAGGISIFEFSLTDDSAGLEVQIALLFLKIHITA
jgi:hypothetical protein